HRSEGVQGAERLGVLIRSRLFGNHWQMSALLSDRKADPAVSTGSAGSAARRTLTHHMLICNAHLLILRSSPCSGVRPFCSPRYSQPNCPPLPCDLMVLNELNFHLSLSF